jgi:hypothetical protein
MKAVFSLSWSVLLYLCLVACSHESPTQETVLAKRPEPEPYLYKPPTPSANGLPSDKLKKEALAEGFVSRLSSKAPAGVLVLQHEKLVLEEYYSLDSTALVCVDPLFPAYVGAMLGSVGVRRNSIPYQPIPLQELYPTDEAASSLSPKGTWQTSDPEQQAALLQRFNSMIWQQTGATQGMVAEENLFEPLQIDDYTRTDSSLCMHPHDVLKLGSVWVHRGRWADEQILSDELVKRVLAPAYDGKAVAQKKAFGWYYYRLMAKGRKQPLLYWKGQGAHLFLLPELQAVILLQGHDESLMQDAWPWLQQYLIPSLN